MGHRYDSKLQREEFGPALITYTIGSAVGAKDITLEQFMPSMQAKKTDPRIMEPTEISTRVKMLAEMLGGTFTSGKTNS